MTAITPIDISVLAALRACGRRNAGDAVRDRLDAGQRAAARGERAQEHDEADAAGEPDMRRIGHVRRRPAEDEAAHEADGDRGADRDDEAVRGQGEHEARLAHAAQVDEHEHDEHAEAQLDRVRRELGHRRGDRQHAGGDRDGGGQHVVGRAATRPPRARPVCAEVLLRHDVRAAAVGVGEDRLPVREDDHDEQRRDDRRDRDDQAARGDRRRDQHDEARLGRVGDGRERVRGEDRQRDPAREQLVLEAAHRHAAADERALDAAARDAHPARSRPAGRRRRARRCPHVPRRTASTSDAAEAHAQAASGGSCRARSA